MKSLLACAALCMMIFVSCDAPGPETSVEADTVAKLPDSVPQPVMIGKGGNYAYYPDTAVYEVVLGDANNFKKFTFENGDKGETNGNRRCMNYFNTIETEMLSVFTTEVKGKIYPFGLRVVKNSDTIGNEKRPHGYGGVNHYLSGHGIYIGEPVEFVQSVYKSQTMMKWVKGDTTYLSYTPAEKDSKYFTRYAYTDYSALYKFVNDQLRVMEMWVKPETFESN